MSGLVCVCQLSGLDRHVKVPLQGKVLANKVSRSLGLMESKCLRSCRSP